MGIENRTTLRLIWILTAIINIGCSPLANLLTKKEKKTSIEKVRIETLELQANNLTNLTSPEVKGHISTDRVQAHIIKALQDSSASGSNFDIDYIKKFTLEGYPHIMLDKQAIDLMVPVSFEFDKDKAPKKEKIKGEKLKVRFKREAPKWVMRNVKSIKCLLSLSLTPVAMTENRIGFTPLIHEVHIQRLKFRGVLKPLSRSHKKISQLINEQREVLNAMMYGEKATFAIPFELEVFCPKKLTDIFRMDKAEKEKWTLKNDTCNFGIPLDSIEIRRDATLQSNDKIVDPVFLITTDGISFLAGIQKEEKRDADGPKKPPPPALVAKSLPKIQPNEVIEQYDIDRLAQFVYQQISNIDNEEIETLSDFNGSDVPDFTFNQVILASATSTSSITTAPTYIFTVDQFKYDSLFRIYKKKFNSRAALVFDDLGTENSYLQFTYGYTSDLISSVLSKNPFDMTHLMCKRIRDTIQLKPKEPIISTKFCDDNILNYDCAKWCLRDPLGRITCSCDYHYDVCNFGCGGFWCKLEKFGCKAIHTIPFVLCTAANAVGWSACQITKGASFLLCRAACGIGNSYLDNLLTVGEVIPDIRLRGKFNIRVDSLQNHGKQRIGDKGEGFVTNIYGDYSFTEGSLEGKYTLKPYPHTSCTPHDAKVSKTFELSVLPRDKMKNSDLKIYFQFERKGDNVSDELKIIVDEFPIKAKFDTPLINDFWETLAQCPTQLIFGTLSVAVVQKFGSKDAKEKINKIFVLDPTFKMEKTEMKETIKLGSPEVEIGGTKHKGYLKLGAKSFNASIL